MPIVYAVPAPEPERAPRRVARFMSWTGANGEEFILSSDDANPAMQRGVQGLHMPRIERHTIAAPLGFGAEYTGYNIPERTAFWPLMFSSVDGYTAFFDSFHPTEPGVWRVGEGDEERRLMLVGDFDGSDSFDIDPFLMGYLQVGVELVAPVPLWLGREQERTYFAEPEPDFIPADPEDQNYYPTSVTGYSTATIRNPGNEPAYVQWVVEGPHPPGVVLGVGSFTVQVPFEIPEGSVFNLDTDPSKAVATLDGVDKTIDLGFQVFAPVAPGSRSPLVIASGGTGPITVKLTPLYWRAY